MSAYQSVIPSGTTNGKMVLVTATATAGTILHTAIAGTNHMDEIFVWAVNASASAIKLTIEFGGVTAPGDIIEQTIQPESGLTLVVPGIRLENGLVVRAFAGTGSQVSCAVNVNRIIDPVSAS